MHFTGAIPSLPDFSGEWLIVNNMAYTRMPGDKKYLGQTESNLTSFDPLVTPLAIISAGLAAANDKRLSPELLGMEDVQGNTCYHIRVQMTPQVMNEKLLLGGTAFGNGTADLWITKDGFNLAELQFSGAAPTTGGMTIRVVFSNWDNVDPISPPDPSQFNIQGIPTDSPTN